MFALLLLLSAASAAAAAVSQANPAVGNRVPHCRRALPASALRIAKKWADKRGLPLPWVVATINLESCNDPLTVGDEGDRSVGYMQVNTVAHGAEMARAGVTRAKMFEPETNVEWGTAVMKKAVDDIRAAYTAKKQPITLAQLGQIMRVYYRGPAYVMRAIAAGKDPRQFAYPDAPQTVARWDRALAETQAIV